MTTAFARAIEGIPVVSSTTERDLLFPVPSRDQRVQDRSTGAIYRYTGVAWMIDFMPGGLALFDISAAPFSAVGNDSADDSQAIQEALDAIAAAGAGVLYIPNRTFKHLSDLTFDTSGGARLWIMGGGAGSILKPKGTTNKGLHIYGTPGSTVPLLRLSDFKVQGATSGTCPALIHLDGLAGFWARDVHIAGAATNGFQLTGAQQGEISGGFLGGATTLIRLEDSGSISSNGVEIHGTQMFPINGGNGVIYNGVDDGGFHDNHITGGVGATGVTCVDIQTVGSGKISVVRNHFELYDTGVKSAGYVTVDDNKFYGVAPAKDVWITGGRNALIRGNQFSGNVQLDAASSGNWLESNFIPATSTITDNATATTWIENRDTSGGYVGPSKFQGPVQFPGGITGSPSITKPTLVTSGGVSLVPPSGQAFRSGTVNGTQFMDVGLLHVRDGDGAQVNAKIKVAGGITLDGISNDRATWTTTQNATVKDGLASELITLSTGGTTTDSTAFLLPANSVIDAVSWYVETAITGAGVTGFQIGDATQAQRFQSTFSTLTAGQSGVGLNHRDPTVATANLGPVQTTAVKVRITAIGGTPTAGKIRVVVCYRTFTAPTS
jgi:hypothetical protein